MNCPICESLHYPDKTHCYTCGGDIPPEAASTSEETVRSSAVLGRGRELKTYVSAEINLCNTISMLNDRERIEWITALLETISEEGTIDAARTLVNDPRWND